MKVLKMEAGVVLRDDDLNGSNEIRTSYFAP